VYPVHVGEQEAKFGLLLTPSEKLITVSNKPVLDVLFSQFRATITGTVFCMGQ
jgi:hypothetical protein